jgi:hypothetical protein
MDAWLDEHQDDAVIVGMLDLMRLTARLSQIAERPGDSPAREKAIRRLCDTDLPRLEAVLPPEALEIVAEEIR